MDGTTVETVSTNHGIMLGPGTFIPGQVGQAFDTDQGAACIQVPASSSLNVGAGDRLTIECWINPATVSGAGPVVEWNLPNDGNAYGTHLWASIPNQAPGVLFANLVDLNGDWHAIAAPAATTTAGEFQHIALTYDKPSGLARLYRNGTVVAQANLGSFTPQTSHDLWIGCRPPGNVHSATLNGLIDEVRLYNRALSAGEIAAIHDSGLLPPPESNCTYVEGATAWWPFEESLVDRVAGLVMQPSLGSPVSYLPGKVGTALRSSSPYAYTVAASDALDIGAGPGLTIEMWLNLDQPYSTPLLVWNVADPPAPAMRCSARDEAVQFVLSGTVVGTQDPVTVTLNSPVGTVPVQSWQHVAMVYDRTAGEAAIYANGVLVARTNTPDLRPSTTGDLYVGRFGPTRFRGIMDELTLYNRALTAQEILAIFNAGGDGKCSNAPPAEIPPTIVTQPESMRVNEGDTVLLSVLAQGSPPLTYQWFRNDTLIAGATNASLALDPVAFDDAGTYYATVSNAFGIATSSNAVLSVNRVPIADASGTRTVFVLPPCTNSVRAVLNGTRSRDPDGDPLDYQWLVAVTNLPVATSRVAVVCLPLGQHAFDLVVNDGMAAATDRVEVLVITPREALARLIASVRQSDWEKPQSLLASLLAAQASLERCHAVATVNQLGAFQNKVSAQAAPATRALAAQWSRAARQIVLALTACDRRPGHPHGHLHARHHGGRPKLEFGGEAGALYLIEASTNMVTWECIGVIEADENGKVDFEDLDAGKFPCRFYRVVEP